MLSDEPPSPSLTIAPMKITKRVDGIDDKKKA